MSIGLIGRKCGMTRIFTEKGESIPVSVIEVQLNRIVQIKSNDNDGYRAIQVTVGNKSASKISKALKGHYAKAEVEAGLGLWEFRLDENDGAELSLGSVISADIVKSGDFVDVQGVTKGKGFAGTIKRHHFAAQDATHGNSRSHRVPGSIGQRQTPGRVFKGKKMAGHLGNANRTIRNLEVVRVDVDRNLLLVKGGIPGAPGGFVVVNLV